MSATRLRRRARCTLQRAQRAHHRGAVGQRQPFLGGQRHRLQAGPPQRLRAGQPFAAVLRLAQPDQHQRHVGQRGQIAAGAQRAFLRDARMHAAVEHVQQQLQRLDADAGMAARQRVGADQHDRAHGGGVQRIARADRVADQDVALQLGDLLGRDQPVLERAEAGGDAVGDLAAVQQRLHGIRGALDKLHGRLAELDQRLTRARRTRPRRHLR